MIVLSKKIKRGEEEQVASKMKLFLGVVLLSLLLLISFSSNLHLAFAYTPKGGDSFNYSETITVNNGTGSYTGYTDQSQVTGLERVTSVSGSNVSTYYSYTYQYSNNQGSSTSASSSGNYTWSSSSFTYVSGTDNQSGFGGLSYSRPLYVWFAMNQSLPVGATFYVLNTKFTVLSKNFTIHLPTENKYVQTIQAEGTGTYQRNDSYGVFTTSYTWYEYFDPTTGYIVGYNYIEQDTGEYQGQSGSFTYTDNLYVTSTSYSLTLVSAPTNATSTTSKSSTTTPSTVSIDPIFVAIAVVIALLFAFVIIFVATRRRKSGKEDSLPKHPYPPTAPPPSPPTTPSPTTTPWESKFDLGAQPPQQVVIRDVAKVNCKFCGTLIPSTADTCPYCGAPRQ